MEYWIHHTADEILLSIILFIDKILHGWCDPQNAFTGKSSFPVSGQLPAYNISGCWSMHNIIYGEAAL